MTTMNKRRPGIQSRAPLELHIGAAEKGLGERLESWKAKAFNRRLWAKDPALWAPQAGPETAHRLGWLDLAETMKNEAAEIISFAREIRGEGFTHAVVLGMGGSSLAPDVLARTFRRGRGFPVLSVLDSTHPAAVGKAAQAVDLTRTLFLVSSKSGTTIEPLSFFRYFWSRLRGRTHSPGLHFVAITDPETPLAALARERNFRRIFLAPPDVGGRFSALTPFGLVPAALMGIDIRRFLERGRAEAEGNRSAASPRNADGLRLAAALGELGRARDKLTFLTSAEFTAFPDWLEQLVAESLGKNGKGILPVAGEPLLPVEDYGQDRVFAALTMTGHPEAKLEDRLAALEKSGQPVIRTYLRDLWDMAAEMLRWELAVASTGAVLGVDPFNQPDVELAKDLARKAMAFAGSAGKTELSRQDSVSVENAASLGRAVRDWLAPARPRNYLAVQAYLNPDGPTIQVLQNLRAALLKKTRLATTLGFGPRFLHSTGQFHKGGPNTGLFLQLVDEPGRDLAIPETDATFGRLIGSQALGDYQALKEKGRRILRVNLGPDPAAGITRLVQALAD